MILQLFYDIASKIAEKGKSGKSDNVKLGDFGIARSMKNTWEMAKTIIGTPYHLSPEIVQGKPYSFKSDIWSLGVLLYQMLMLKMPFDANSLPMLSLKIMKGNFAPITNKAYSADIKCLVKSMLNIDPDKRPSAKDILSKFYISLIFFCRVKYYKK